jgi:ADP-heptose:LPS heptosyltransferase
MEFNTLEEYRASAPKFVFIRSRMQGNVNTGDGVYQFIPCVDMLSTIDMAKDLCNREITILSPRRIEDHYRLYDSQNLNGKTLMVWRTGGIGDLLFIRPILVHLARKYPNCNITLATRQRYESMIQNWGDCLTGASYMPILTPQTVDAADYHLSFQGLIETCKEATTTDVHDLFARNAGIDPDEIEWTAPMAVDKQTDSGYAVIQSSASALVRTPYIGTIIRAINAVTETGRRVYVSDSPEKARAVDDIISCCRHKERVVNFARISEKILDAITLVTYADLVIGPDSSHIHMAGVQGVPAVGIYGPFPGKCRLTRYKNVKYIEPEPSEVCEFGGRHCFRHQYLECPGQYACWQHLDDSKLIQMIKEQLWTVT